MKVQSFGYGHVLIDNNSIAFTSQSAVSSFMETMSILLNSAITDLSEILGLPKEIIMSDYIKEQDLNVIQAAMKDVLKRNGQWNEEFEKTITRHKIEAITNQLGHKEDNYDRK